MSMLAAATSTPIHVPRVEWVAILPELILVGAALVLLTASGLRRARLPRGVHMIATIAAAGGALGAAWYLWAQVSDGKARDAVAGAVVVDGFSVFFMILVSCAVVLGALLADDYLRREDHKDTVLASRYTLDDLIQVANDLISPGSNPTPTVPAAIPAIGR